MSARVGIGRSVPRLIEVAVALEEENDSCEEFVNLAMKVFFVLERDCQEFTSSALNHQLPNHLKNTLR